MKRRDTARPSRSILLPFASLLLMLVASSSAVAQQASTLGAATQISNDAPPSPDAGVAPSPTPAPQDTAATTAPSQEQDDRLEFMQEGRLDNETAPSAGGLLMRTFGALLLIVGLIVGIGYGLRRFGGGRFGATETDAPNLNVIASVALGERRSLAVVRFGSRTLLVGSTPHSLTLLASEDANQDSTTPRVRSVADMLRDEESAQSSFADELLLADQEQDSSRPYRLLDAPVPSPFAHVLPHSARGEIREDA